MRLLIPALLLLSVALVAESADVVCGSGKTKKSVTLRKGDSVAFSTQAGDRYGKKTSCAVMFKRPRKQKCKLTFSCSSFDLTAANSGCTKKSDFIMISKKKYCKRSSPSVTVTGTKLKVLFKSHRKSRGGVGATCTASCSSGTPPATTEAPGGGGGGGGSSGCKCGLAVRNQRIVGGVVTEINEYPWQVGVVSKGSKFVWCGATVISDRWILTAAHCTDGKSPSQIQVLLGEHNYNIASETTSLRMDIMQIKNHESYNDRITDYDFSLLKTTSAMDFSAYPNIRPVCLPQAGSTETYKDWMATVTGWGTLSSDGNTSNRLREVDVKVISNAACKEAYFGIKPRMLCAEAAGGNGGKDACQGDSGGPLVSKAAGSNGVTAGQNYELIGVVSWGAGCADANYPGVYARVTNQLSWITTTAASDWQTCPRT